MEVRVVTKEALLDGEVGLNKMANKGCSALYYITTNYMHNTRIRYTVVWYPYRGHGDLSRE